jgi:hypothetical protein
VEVHLCQIGHPFLIECLPKVGWREELLLLLAIQRANFRGKSRGEFVAICRGMGEVIRITQNEQTDEEKVKEFKMNWRRRIWTKFSSICRKFYEGKNWHYIPIFPLEFESSSC